jgi:hypothetical protein
MSSAGDLMTDVSTTGNPSETSSTLSSTDSDSVSVTTNTTLRSSKFKVEGDKIVHLHYEPKTDIPKNDKENKKVVTGKQRELSKDTKVKQGKKSPKVIRVASANSGHNNESHDRSQSCNIL